MRPRVERSSNPVMKYCKSDVERGLKDEPRLTMQLTFSVMACVMRSPTNKATSVAYRDRM